MITRYVIPILLLVQAVLLLNLNWMTSHNRTEDGHIGAAVYFWKTGRLISRRTIPLVGLAALELAAFVVSSMAQYPHSMSYFSVAQAEGADRRLDVSLSRNVRRDGRKSAI